MRRLALALLILIFFLMPVTRQKGNSPATSAPEKAPLITVAYTEAILAAASNHDLPASLIAAIIKVESGFNPKAVSNRGAIGLMQLGSSTRKAFNVGNPFDPVQNIVAGTAYFKGLLDRFDGDMHKAIAAYNAGPEAVERYKGIPPFGQTMAFVPKVMGYYQQYESGVAVD